MLEYLSIGQIVNTHGFRGEVKVYPLTDNMERFEKLKSVYVDSGKELVPYEVQGMKFLKNTIVMKLKGVDSEEEAEKLRNLYVKVDRKEAVKLPRDTFFICDLIGIEVFDLEGKLLGRVEDVLQTGSNDVYIVRNGEREILIPALKEIFKEVDIEGGKIVVDLPEGLIE